MARFTRLQTAIRANNAERRALVGSNRTKTKQRALERARRKLDREIERMIKRLGTVSSAQFPADMMARISKAINDEGWMENIIKRRFNREKQTVPGANWKPLAPSTIRRRMAQGYGARPILLNTGRLKQGAMDAVEDTFAIGTRGGVRSGRIKWRITNVGVSYASYVHRERPFLLPPTRKEMKPVLARVRRLLRVEIRKALKG